MEREPIDEVVLSSKLRKFMKGKSCCVDLSNEPIVGFPHVDGWKVGDRKLWLYVKCPKCRNMIALWKLGVPRDFVVDDTGDWEAILEKGDHE